MRWRVQDGEPAPYARARERRADLELKREMLEYAKTATRWYAVAGLIAFLLVGIPAACIIVWAFSHLLAGSAGP